MSLCCSGSVRLPHAAKVLANRRKGKTPLEIADEYDAQDILHSIVRAYFKHAVQEEPVKKLANAKSARADFAIEAIGTIVELKYVHGPNDQARIVADLAEDLLLYEQWEHLRDFIYVVYNSDDLHDSEAFEKLNGKRSHNAKHYQVHIVLA